MSVRNLHDELSGWDGWPKAWRSKPGDILVGFVDSYDIGHSAYGDV